jgi:pSer/pThr/pTyr-binding forkhead associated (FHA) protein
MGTPGFVHRLTVILVIDGTAVPLPILPAVIVGRFALRDSAQPDIDLGPYGAEAKGVSRRHICVDSHQGHLRVIDLGSSNGTWLNGERLKPIAEYPLQHGDKLRLGKLEMAVKLGTTAPQG